MRIAVISDLHGNWEALQAVAAAIQEARAEAVICLGDVVGYGPDPVACLEWVAEHSQATVLGNHEAAVLDPSLHHRMSRPAREAIVWTAAQLRPWHREILAAWPLTARAYGSFLVHSSPRDPGAFSYIMTGEEYADALSALSEEVGFFGHTHAAGAGEWDLFHHAFRRLRSETVIWLPDCRYLINPGSVGQPRDGDPRASWVLWDRDRVVFQRTAYPVAVTQKKIMQAGLPEILGVRLAAGE